ncbi:hypothetical protein [Scytonema sp. NUACC26]|uniref:hypothetical protein n=1 Tax=Scytonema sp. NUACC26 TaxID=3140176 RepID=UPI0034DBF732
MPLHQVDVKGYTRKGKLVKAYKRKQDKKNIALKVAIGTASALGISAATYLVLKKRYVNNLDDIAKNLKVDPSLGKEFDKNIKDITFTIGGLTGNAAQKNTDPHSQARFMSAFINNHLSNADKKIHKVVALQHSFDTDNKKLTIVNIAERVELLNKPFFTGRNNEAAKLAEEIYNYSVKNPDKQVNIFGFSAGSNLGRDVQYILDKKGVKVNLATIGSANFRLTPDKKSLNFVGTKDYVQSVKTKGSIMIPDAEHHPEPYLKSEIVRNELFKYFYNQKPYTKS